MTARRHSRLTHNNTMYDYCCLEADSLSLLGVTAVRCMMSRQVAVVIWVQKGYCCTAISYESPLGWVGGETTFRVNTQAGREGRTGSDQAHVRHYAIQQVQYHYSINAVINW